MKIGKKTIVLMGLPLGIGIAAALVVLFVLKPFGGGAPAGIPDPGPGQHGVMLPLDTKVVNLAAGSDYKYAKVGVTLELRPEKVDFYTAAAADREVTAALVVKDMAELLPVLDDAVATIVASKTSAELNTADGREQLRQELLEAVRKVLDGPPAAPAAPAASADPSGAPVAAPEPTKVLDLYFTDLVMQ